jgi:uncharacterized membrane protein
MSHQSHIVLYLQDGFQPHAAIAHACFVSGRVNRRSRAAHSTTHRDAARVVSELHHIRKGLTVMEYGLLKFAHIIGAVIIGAGLIGVWMADLRSRQLRELKSFSEAVRNIAVFYDGLVVPGALLLLISGTWMVVRFYGGWTFLQVPWLAGMVGLFAFEFIEGNTITRLYFMRLRRITRSALAAGGITPELECARGERVPTFTHFLDLPLLFLIIALGAMQPTTWMLFFAGSIAAIVLATLLTILIPRLYPWGSEVLPT